MVISLCCQKSSVQQFRDGLVTVMTENQAPYDFALPHAVSSLKVISWSRMATGVPSITSEFQHSEKERKKKNMPSPFKDTY